MSTIEDQKGLFDKYTKRLQVVRDIKERQSVEFQGMRLWVQWFEPRSISSLYSMIVRVSVVLRRTVVLVTDVSTT